MIRQAVGGLLLASILVAPAIAREKANPKLTNEAKDGVQTTQDNIIKMKLKTALQPIVGGPPAAPALPAPSPLTRSN